MSRFSLSFVLCILLSSLLSAQRLPDADVPPPPLTRLSDEDGILSQKPEAARRITKMLQKLERDHGYRMFVILESALISTTASDYASQLQQEWLPDGGGLVIVFESDTRKLGFGRELGAKEGMQPDQIGVPAFSLVQIISEALHKIGEEETTEDYVEKLVTEITTGLTAWFKLREAPMNSGHSLRLALIAIGSLAFLALCGMGISWLMGNADKKQSSVRIFPEIDLPERLGASYGGGTGATNDFSIGKKN
ncbi:MAG: TPM domain-containing protein [Verrucomicrobia bacterium]|nr:TPM domain-containing protein [Verrucomicrobiota bacterium]